VVDELAGTGATVRRRYVTFPLLSMELTPKALDAARRSPDVASITKVFQDTTDDVASWKQVEADQMQVAGYTGLAQFIAILDTGIQADHPALAGRIAKEYCFTSGDSCPNGTNTQAGIGAAAPCTYAPAQCDHGTHVAGIAAGDGDLGVQGVAPSAYIISIQVFSKTTGSDCTDLGFTDPCATTYSDDQVAALDQVNQLTANEPIAAVNMSLGSGQYSGSCDQVDPDRTVAFQNLGHNGVAVVVSAGNAGYRNAMALPACISTATSVGAVDSSDKVTSFSDISSTTDLLAPGNNILSSVPGNGTGTKNGTSMAAPHVTGAFALLRQVYPGTDETKLQQAMRDTGLAVTDTRTNGKYTIPRLDVFKASSLPSIGFVPFAFFSNEGSGHAVITVGREGSVAFTSKVHYATQNGTAAAPADYTATSGTLTFLPGQSIRTFNVPIIDDSSPEGNETVTLKLSAPSNANLLPNPTRILTITENDRALRFATSVTAVSEAAGSVTVNVTRLGGLGGSISVHYATSDVEATAGKDYTAKSGTLTFATDVTNQSITVPIAEDVPLERTESFLITLSSPTAGVLLASPKVTEVRIKEDDSGLIFRPGNFAVLENQGPATVYVERAGPTGVAVSGSFLTSGGTATPGVDYTSRSGTLSLRASQNSSYFMVQIFDDPELDPFETVGLKMGLARGASASTLNIIDNEAGFKLLGVPGNLIENGGAKSVIVERQGYQALTGTVDFATTDGTATGGTDYQVANGTLTFAPYQQQKTISLVPIDDAVADGDETFSLGLSNGVNGDVVGANPIVVTIHDDENAMRFSSDSYEVNEGGGTVTITVQRVGTGSKVASVQYATSDGRAFAGSDYTATSGTLNFPVGLFSATFTVPITQDATSEPHESFFVTLSNPSGSGVLLGTPSQATVTIHDDDPAP
jgi:subtilisin family serine protease